jgi:hypothetical protein
MSTGMIDPVAEYERNWQTCGGDTAVKHIIHVLAIIFFATTMAYHVNAGPSEQPVEPSVFTLTESISIKTKEAGAFTLPKGCTLTVTIPSKKKPKKKVYAMANGKESECVNQ